MAAPNPPHLFHFLEYFWLKCYFGIICEFANPLFIYLFILRNAYRFSTSISTLCWGWQPNLSDVK